MSTLPDSIDDADWGARALAEIDYGIVVINASRDVLYRNPVAARYLRQERGLRLAAKRLVASESCQQKRFDLAIEAVMTQGHRKMLVLGSRESRIGAAAVRITADTFDRVAGQLGGPVSSEAHRQAGIPHAMLTLSRQQLAQTLSIYGFARDHSLSNMEESVLLDLCRGLSPAQIAKRNGSKLSTVRAQIVSIRAKTSFDSVTDLVQWISTLPPMLLRVECS